MGEPEIVEGSWLDVRQQLERSLQLSGLAFRAGGDEQALCPARRLGCECGGALEERARRPPIRLVPVHAPPSARARRRRPRLAWRRLARGAKRADPGRTPGRSLAPGLDGQRGAPPVPPRDIQLSGQADDGRPLGRPSSSRPSASTMAAADRGDSELPGRPPHQCRVADRVSRGDKQKASRVGWQARQPSRKALLDARGQRHRRRQTKSARELCWRQPARQLDESERIPAGLGNDPLQHALIEPRRQARTPTALAHRRCPSGLTWSCGRPASTAPRSRAANTSAIFSASRRRATNASARADAWSSQWASSTIARSGRSSAASDSRPRTANPTSNGSGAGPVTQSERDGERVVLGLRETVDRA